MNRLNRAAAFPLTAFLVFALCAAALIGPDAMALAAPVKAGLAHLAGPVPHLDFSHVVTASFALTALRTQEGDLVARAAAKLAEVTPEMAPDAVRAIEAEHAALVTEIDAVRVKIGEAERAAPAPVPSASPEASTAAALAIDRTRIAEISAIGRRAGFEQADIDTAIANGTGVEVFRARAFERLAAASEATMTRSTGRIVITGESEEAKRGAAIENALMHRFSPAAVELTDHAREYRGMTLLEIGAACLEGRGQRVRGLSKHERAQAMLNMRSEVSDLALRAGGSLATADFPSILANVANKTLRMGYQAAAQTFRPLVRVVTVPDFKQVLRAQLGAAPRLEKVNEAGEFKRGAMADSGERYAVSTYGKIVTINRQVIINDDLDAFTRIPRAFGVQAANLESDLVWGQITANPVMADGNAVFSAAHGNMGSAATISAGGVGTGRQAMRLQTDLDGKTLLNISPAYIVVPVALETPTEQFLGQIFPTKSTDVVTTSMRKLVPISEPRLDAASATNWYLAGSPDQIDVIELAYLEGMEGLYTETRMGWDVDGVEVKVRQDVGAKVIDYRGLWRSN